VGGKKKGVGLNQGRRESAGTVREEGRIELLASIVGIGHEGVGWP
jgi:hypothetical protein